MTFGSWIVEHWSGIIENVGVVGGLVFTGIALRIDARVRRASTLIEINKQHREIWMAFMDRPSVAGLLDEKRDIKVRPLSEEEATFANFIFNHIRVTYYASGARIYTQPEKLGRDIADLFASPAISAAWQKVRPFYDAKFTAFVARSTGRD